MNETKLAEVFAAAGPENSYSRTELEDVMAVLFLKSYQNVPMSSGASDVLLAGFFERVGVQSENDLEDLPKLMTGYFEAHPLRNDLLQEVLTAFDGGKTQPKPLRAGYAISSAF